MGVGGPVGSGKTALMDALCKRLRDRYEIAAITNDIYTKWDAEYLVRSGALPPERASPDVRPPATIGFDVLPPPSRQSAKLQRHCVRGHPGAARPVRDQAERNTGPSTDILTMRPGLASEVNSRSCALLAPGQHLCVPGGREHQRSGCPDLQLTAQRDFGTEHGHYPARRPGPAREDDAESMAGAAPSR